MDGVSNCQGARVGIILISSKGIRMEKPFELGFQASNNETKYEALLMGLQMSNEVRARRLQLHCDFQLVVNQVSDEFEAKDQRMMGYLKEVKVLKRQFERVKISQISRGNNSHADFLATLASSMADPLLRIVSVKLLPSPNAFPLEKVLILSIRPSPSWMDPFVAYLQGGILPEDRKEAKQVRRRSPRYWVSKEGSSTKDCIQDLICYVYILRQSKYFQKNCMKEYMEVTREEGLWPIEPLLRGIGGQICKSKRKTSLRNVINAKSSLLAFTSLRNSLIQYPVRGRLPNVGQTQQDLFLKQLAKKDGSQLGQTTLPSGSKLSLQLIFEILTLKGLCGEIS